MKRTIVILGRTPHLAFAELQALYPATTLLTADVAVIPESLDAQELMRKLGGTVKIADEVGATDTITSDSIFEVLLPYVTAGKITFGVSGYGSAHIPTALLTAVKKLFLAQQVAVRFAEAKHDNALGSVVVEKQHLTELVVIGVPGTYILGVTGAVQDFEDWNTRDSARPAPDPKRGMLPPKVARMIVNIALGPEPAGKTLLDPFCGVGTVLGEALLRTATAVGFDISKDAVVKAQKNIAWLRAQYGLLHREATRIELGDATHVSDLLPPGSVDAIATEPLLGEQIRVAEGETVSSAKVKNIIKGLEKLYIGCLREWGRVVKPGARVIMAMPSYVTDHGTVTVKKVVDRCEILGYTLLTGPIEYGRPQATVRREFYIFQKK